jgi:hypothetical protein
MQSFSHSRQHSLELFFLVEAHKVSLLRISPVEWSVINLVWEGGFKFFIVALYLKEFQLLSFFHVTLLYIINGIAPIKLGLNSMSIFF